MGQARLKTPRGQRKFDDEKGVKDKGPKFAVIDDTAEMLYQVFSAALSHRGPRGVPLKLWHELANVERKAWRMVETQVRLMLQMGDRLAVRAPGPNQFTIAITSDTTWVGRIVDMTSIKSVTDLRKLVHEMELQLAQQDAAMKEEAS